MRRTRRFRRQPKIKSKTEQKTEIIAKKVVNNALKRSVETKQYDGQIPSTAISASGDMISALEDANAAATITQGADNQQYVGDTIQPTGLRFRYNINNTDDPQMFRVLVIQFKGLAGLTPADILQSVGNVRTPLSDYDCDHMHEFRVLYDKLHLLTAPYSAGQRNAGNTVYIPGHKLSKVRFSDNAGTVSSGNIQFVLYSDSTAVGHPVIQMFHRLYYKDA